MAAGDLITGPYQAELNGLLLGAGTDYPIAESGIEGLGIPSMRDADTDRGQADGVIPGPDFYPSKPITIEVSIFGDTPGDAETKVLALLGAFKAERDLAVTQLVYRLAGAQKYRINGRPRRAAPKLRNLKSATPSIVCQFVATDPKSYDNTESHGGPVGPGSQSGGLGLPHGFPHGFGTAAPGTVNANNAGTEPTFPRARVTAGVGGINGFVITNGTTGEILSVTLTVAQGDFVDIDFAARTILLNGLSSRSGNVNRPASKWWDLDPGITPVTFATSGSGTATLDFYWRSALGL